MPKTSERSDNVVRVWHAEGAGLASIRGLSIEPLAAAPPNSPWPEPGLDVAELVPFLEQLAKRFRGRMAAPEEWWWRPHCEREQVAQRQKALNDKPANAKKVPRS